MENQIRCMMFLLFVEDLQYQEVKVIQPRNRDLFLLSSVDTNTRSDKVIRKRLCCSLSGSYKY